MIRKLKFIVTNIYMQLIAALQWRHNEHGGISNHQPYECLLNRLFRRRSNEIPKLRVTGLCAGNSPVIHWWLVNYPHWGPVAWKLFPFDDVIMQRYIEMKWNNHRDDPFLQCIQLLHSLSKMYSEDIYARGTETPILVHDAGVGSNTEPIETLPNAETAKGQNTESSRYQLRKSVHVLCKYCWIFL